jgi:nickel-dependent lactate racemase
VTTTTDPLTQLASQAARLGGPDQVLAEEAVAGFVADQLAAQDLDGQSVCVVIPDATRSCPLPLLLSAVHGALAGRVSRMTALVALGTHAPMTEAHRGDGETLVVPEAGEVLFRLR